MNREKVWDILILSTYVLMLAVLVFFINEKSNLHMDEVSSYCGANNSYDDSISIHVDYAYKYNNPSEVWTRQMTVDKNHRFDYGNTYRIMSYDNHPPFYYYLLHTISSFFPGVYSKWFAGIINIICGLGILFFSQKTVFLLTEDKISVFISSLLLCFSGGMISAATYFRNYYIGILFIVAVTYLLLKGIKEQNKSFYISLIILMALGVMTHYYIAIYYFFISAFYVIYKLLHRRGLDAIKYIAAAIASGVLYIVLDYESLNTIFSGNDRSGEVMGNLGGTFPVLMSKIWRCFNLVNAQIFSKLLFVPAILSIALIVYILLVKKEKINKEKTEIYIMLLGGIIGYMVFVSIITVYETPRYFYPVYSVILITVFCILQNCIMKINNKLISYATLTGVFVLCTVVMFKANIHYLYRSTSSLIDKSREYSNMDCIFITEHSYDVNSSFYEVSNYKSVTFYNYDNYDEIINADIDVSNGVIVSYNCGCDIEAVNCIIFDRWPELVYVTDVGSHEGNVTKLYRSDVAAFN